MSQQKKYRLPDSRFLSMFDGYTEEMSNVGFIEEGDLLNRLYDYLWSQNKAIEDATDIINRLCIFLAEDDEFNKQKADAIVGQAREWVNEVRHD